jgi:hypothetical protein
LACSGSQRSSGAACDTRDDTRGTASVPLTETLHVTTHALRRVGWPFTVGGPHLRPVPTMRGMPRRGIGSSVGASSTTAKVQVRVIPDGDVR